MPWDVFGSLLEGLTAFPQARMMSFAGFNQFVVFIDGASDDMQKSKIN